MQCLFLLSSISNSGRRSLRHLASIENSLLPGKKSISSLQPSPFRQPIVKMLSSSAEYFKNPPTLSSSFIILQIVLRQCSFASFYEHPIILAIRFQSVIPYQTTRERSFSSYIFYQLKVPTYYSSGFQLIFSFYQLQICSQGTTQFSFLLIGSLFYIIFLSLCERMLSFEAGFWSGVVCYFFMVFGGGLRLGEVFFF